MPYAHDILQILVFCELLGVNKQRERAVGHVGVCLAYGCGSCYKKRHHFESGAGSLFGILYFVYLNLLEGLWHHVVHVSDELVVIAARYDVFDTVRVHDRLVIRLLLGAQGVIRKLLLT